MTGISDGRDPRALGELRDHHDGEHDAGGDRADRVDDEAHAASAAPGAASGGPPCPAWLSVNPVNTPTA